MLKGMGRNAASAFPHLSNPFVSRTPSFPPKTGEARFTWNLWMAHYLFSRLIQSLVLLALVSVIAFAVLRLAPGGPLSQFALVPGMTQEQLAHISHEMGLDRSLPVQYWEWISRLLTGDWGHSYRDNQPVLAVIVGRLPATFELMLTAIVIAVLLGVSIGILGAVRRGSLFDTRATARAMGGALV